MKLNSCLFRGNQYGAVMPEHGIWLKTWSHNIFWIWLPWHSLAWYYSIIYWHSKLMLSLLIQGVYDGKLIMFLSIQVVNDSKVIVYVYPKCIWWQVKYMYVYPGCIWWQVDNISVYPKCIWWQVNYMGLSKVHMMRRTGCLVYIIINLTCIARDSAQLIHDVTNEK